MLEWLYRIIGGPRTMPSELRAKLIKAGVMTDTSACATAKPWNDIAAQGSGKAVATMVPGDTLVVTCERALHREQIEKIKAGILADLPAGCKVAVLHGGLAVGAVAQQQPMPTPTTSAGWAREATHRPPPIGTDGAHSLEPSNTELILMKMLAHMEIQTGIMTDNVKKADRDSKLYQDTLSAYATEKNQPRQT